MYLKYTPNLITVQFLFFKKQNSQKMFVISSTWIKILMDESSWTVTLFKVSRYGLECFDKH